MTTRLSFLVARTICLLQAVNSEGIGQHLSRLYNHLVDMLVAQVLCSYRWICVETEDVHFLMLPETYLVVKPRLLDS